MYQLCSRACDILDRGDAQEISEEEQRSAVALVAEVCYISTIPRSGQSQDSVLCCLMENTDIVVISYIRTTDSGAWRLARRNCGGAIPSQ